MAKDRDNKGRFTKGNRLGAHSRGRPTDAARLELHAIIDKNVSRKSANAAWKRLDSVLSAGGKGWLEYFKFYLDRRYGRPEQFVSTDVTTGGAPLRTNMVTLYVYGDTESEGES